MAPELHFQFYISFADTTHYDPPATAGAPVTERPLDSDRSASADAMLRLRDLIESRGGRYSQKLTHEYGDPPERMLKSQLDRLIAEFDDGVVGRAFLQDAWPIAEGWLRNKELRMFRAKYRDDVLTLGGAADVERLLDLMKDAAPAPKQKAPKAASPAKKAKKAKARPAKKVAKAKAKPVKKAAKANAKPARKVAKGKGKPKPKAKRRK